MRILLVFLMLLASPAWADDDDVCRDLIAAMPHLKGETPLVSSRLKVSYKKLFDDCDDGDTFAGYSLGGYTDKHGKYHRYRCHTVQNTVTHLGSYPDHTVAFTAKAAVDLDGSKLGCGAGFPNQCGTALKFDKPGSEHPSVNAEDTPFVVVPRDFVLTDPATKKKRLITSFTADTGIGQGDLAAVVWGQHCTFGVVGDAGPHFRLGELSMRAHADLGNPQCVVPGQYPCQAVVRNNIGHGIDADVSYFIFPGTRPVPLYSQNVNDTSADEASDHVQTFIDRFAR